MPLAIIIFLHYNPCLQKYIGYIYGIDFILMSYHLDNLGENKVLIEKRSIKYIDIIYTYTMYHTIL